MTPAPWTLKRHATNHQTLMGATAGLIADIHKDEDASLISAAPDLLNMLRDAENWFREYDVQNSPDSGAQLLLADIRAAIAKATGAA